MDNVNVAMQPLSATRPTSLYQQFIRIRQVSLLNAEFLY